MKTILVVDDSPTMRMLLETNLKRIPDVKIIQAGDGREALEKIAASAPDVVLTDLNMPNLDGFRLVEELRLRIGDQKTAIIVVTTRGEDAVAQKALALGANAFVTKPIVAHQLLETVTRLLG